MVQAALRAPAGEGGFDLRCNQAQITQWRMVEQVVGMGVHVAHQDLMAVSTDQFTDVGKLAGAGPGTKRKMHHDHDQRVLAFAEAHQDRTAAGGTGQRMIFQHMRLEAAEHPIAVLGEMPKVAVELLVPVREAPQLGQVLHLIDVT
ncbi:hypothetical protein D3C79_861390 [compost metagenome]